MHLDIDEFLNIHVVEGQIADLIAALPDADAIALTWRMFGNNGIIEYKDRLITDQFARAAPKMCESAKDVFVFYDLDSPENVMHAALCQGDNVTHLRSIVKSVDPAEFFQATRFLPAIAALTSDNPSREFYKLQRARREMLRHLRTLLAQAQARPAPLLTKLACQHTLRLHPTAPKFV